jgi:hypothetical protein
VDGRHHRHIAPTPLRHVLWFHHRFLARQTDRGLHDRPLTPPSAGRRRKLCTPRRKKVIDHVERIAYALSHRIASRLDFLLRNVTRLDHQASRALLLLLTTPRRCAAASSKSTTPSVR